MTQELTVDIARAYFAYDRTTGVLSRKVTIGHQVAGSVCQSRKGNGYFQVEFNKRNFLVHRVVWLIETGSWPTNHIDHLDGDKLNNRIGNLRDVPRSMNMQNIRKARCDNKLGLLGVSTDTRNGSYFARIVVNKKTTHLGRYQTPEAAHAAYLAAKRAHHAGNTL